MNFVNSKNFQNKIIESKKPVLLAYINQFFDYENQTGIISQISNSYKGTLKAYIVDEDDSVIINMLGILGSPTYFIFFQGNEIKKALGVQDQTSLFSFISTALQGIGINKYPDEIQI